METNRNDPLHEIAEARAAAADRLVTPRWYHPVLGTLLGVYVVVIAWGNTWVDLVAVVVLLVGVFTLISTYKRITGVWVDGFQRGPARKWALLTGVGLAVLMLLAIFQDRVTGHLWPTVVLGILVVPLTIVLGNKFDATLRRSLREGA